VKPPQTQDLILVTGLSGGGKSTALHALEDLGYYCVDNLPAALLKDFARQIKTTPDLYARVALGVDARSHPADLQLLPERLNELRTSGLKCQVLFLDADIKVILQRFSETRRRHPLTTEQHALPDAITLEHRLLGALKHSADWVIDTSDTNIHQLRRQVWKCAEARNDTMSLVVESFAFKNGIPQDVDFSFDVRHLPNPHWVPELRDYTGLDRNVREWLEQDSMVRKMDDDIREFLLRWLPGFQAAQRSYVTIGIGCTGGRHRSVYLVDSLARALRKKYPRVTIHHRELTP
jgi:UPF0042 nucleotide-binding protein